MLKGISPLLSPDLLYAIARMGHGDEMVLADANFPAESIAASTGCEIVRADGLSVTEILDAMLPLFPIDTYNGTPLFMMAAVPGDTLDPALERDYRTTLDKHGADWAKIDRIERFAFYDRAKSSFRIVQTGETRKYANLLLRKGVVCP